MLGVAHMSASSETDRVDDEDDQFAESMGSRIKRARLDAGLTQQVLATAVGVRTATIGDYEKGRINASTKVVRAIADETGVSAGWLMGDESRVDREADDDGDYPALVDFLASRTGQTATPDEIEQLRSYRAIDGKPTVAFYGQMLMLIRTALEPDPEVAERFTEGDHMRGSLDRFKGK